MLRWKVTKRPFVNAFTVSLDQLGHSSRPGPTVLKTDRSGMKQERQGLRKKEKPTIGW